jgi:hypothetical protein
VAERDGAEVNSLSQRSVGFLALVFILGILVGSLVSQAIGLFLPSGSVAHQLFVQPTTLIDLGPSTVTIILFELTLGFKLTANLMSVIGIFVVAQLLRWLR